MSLLSTLRFVVNHPLNRADRVAAIGRLVRWQITSRLMPTLTALPFVENTHLFTKRSMTGATGNWYCGLHEVNDMAFALHLLRPSDHFADIGANVGSYTILAGGAVGARVTAVEPIPSTFVHLERNILLNNLADQVEAIQCGLSSVAGTLRFSVEMDCMNHVIAPGEDVPYVEVPVVTLDELLQVKRPTLMKIDVEGHEDAVLDGARAVLSDPKLLAVIMETNDSGLRYGVSDATLVSTLAGYGFEPFGYEPFGRQLINHAAAESNTIFVRDRSAVQRRVQESRRYRLINGSI
jgi:FkbM family methyltransferase